MRLAIVLLSMCLCRPMLAQLPEFYRTVDRVVWIVRDLDRVMEGWKKIGFSPIQDWGEVELTGTFLGRPAKASVRAASGLVGDVRVAWIQPLGGSGAYSEFLKKHGDGIFSLVHRVPTLEALNKEVNRLRGLGVAVLERGTQESGAGPIDFAYMDTEAVGKYALGLIHFPDGYEDEFATMSPKTRVTQFAFVARDLDPVSRFWQKLGFPEMSITHSAVRDPRYRGQPGRFDLQQGWQRHGKVVYEWIMPLAGPTVYEEHLKAHGEGVQHLGLPVMDMDKAIAQWTGLGFPVTQSGAWGEEGKKGSGRFAYLDTDPIGGITIELLWSFR